jgi:NAD(P)-dependent dehydrogenase (short-subunit alcohol dehydrogenase family)
MQPYVAMKGALISLSKTIPLDYAVDGIRVNAICQVVVRTPMFQRWAGSRRTKLTSPPIVDRIHPFGNFPKGDVMADAERTRFYEN